MPLTAINSPFWTQNTLLTAINGPYFPMQKWLKMF